LPSVSTPVNSAFRIPRSAFVRRRPGFTLLEVLLAIAITLLVLSLVGMAAYSQLRIIEQTRTEAQQAQVARALLRHIGDDLRNVIKYSPIEVSLPTAGAAAAASGAASALEGSPTGGTGGTGGAGTGGTGGMGSGGTGSGGMGSGGMGPGGTGGVGASQGGGGSGGQGGSPSGARSSGSGSTTSGTSGGVSSDSGRSSSEPSFNPDTIPGVRGFPNLIKIDVSRLPRRDQLLAAEQGVGASGLPSDVKTVAYFVDDPTTAMDGRPGLKRYEISRAESMASIEQGAEESLVQEHAQLLADEVVRINFQYSDGQQWYETWPPAEPQSQQEAAQLPLAVHVILYLKPPGFDAEYGGQDWSGIDVSGFPQRRLIVPLPAAEPAGGSASSSSSSDSSSSNSTGSPSNSSSGTPSSGSSGGASSGSSSGTGGSSRGS
jgi:prepilin-type N-terminal cleavage/methylation domain-containing protein